jgi:hypothetical protein
MGGSITATWAGSYSRDPVVYAAGFPPLAPLAIPVSNTAGQWLFCLVSWRQDAGVAGVLQYPSTCSVSDDANNFWIPVSTVQTGTGIVRSAVWMAPAARAAQYVFVSPTGYQSAMTALVVEVTADCPWYSVVAQASASTNQGTSVTLSQDPAGGFFSFGVLAWDNSTASVSVTATGWTATTSINTANGTDHTGDLVQDAYYLTSSGSAQTISASTATTMDFAEVIVCVSGVTNATAFPYNLPIENWPVLVTEIAAGPTLNANPLFVNGATDWTGQNATAAAVTWPAWNPWPYYQTLITSSLSITPSGSATFGDAQSEEEAVSPTVLYSAVAWAYSVAGYAAGTWNVFLNWFTSGSAYISTSSGPASVPLAGAWTQLTFAAPVYPPATAAFATVGVSVNASTGDVPSSQVYYLGFCGFGPADAYEGVSPDETWWTDLSSRNFTEQSISVTRGIQYEQQALEAGTMTVTLANNDYAMMYGNTESAYWPNIGDTDVPIRLRAIWPGSVTPYAVLFSGFTDDIDFGYNAATRYAYASFTCSDAWSRLTQQLVGAAEQDVLEDSPVDYFTCNGSGANLAPGQTSTVSTWDGPEGPGNASASFTGSVISLAGDPGVSCWQSTTPSADSGVALGYFPLGGGQVLPPVSGGVTVEFWMNPVADYASQPSGQLIVCTCWAGSSPMWSITIDNASSTSSPGQITVYDKSTHAGTTSGISIPAGYLDAALVSDVWFFAVTFTQSSLTITVNPGGVTTDTVTVSCNLSDVITGFSWGGNAGPLMSPNPADTSYGFMAIAIYGIAIYDYLVPPARQASHYQAALAAFPAELDTARLARIAGYAGFTPVLGMRCQDLATADLVLGGDRADVDSVTAATDTSGQVVSDYFTNIASSTLAFMFVNGPGTLVYRRRLECYDRPIGQWAVGEQVSTAINASSLSQSASLTGWATANGATLVSSGLAPGTYPAAGPLFWPFCGLMTGNGSTANPEVTYGSATATPVTAGDWYDVSVWAFCPQGYATGLTAQIVWKTSGGSTVSSVSTGAVALVADGLTFLQLTTPAQAPATAAWAQVLIQAAGTPASTVDFYLASVLLFAVNPVLAGGIDVVTPEAPYLVDIKLSSDRAQLYNQAILTQYGTATQTTFSGTSLDFTPTSGVGIVIQNDASITQRGAVPYTATLYLDNTIQAPPYNARQAAMEDFGNWIVNTLGAPLFRPLTVTITPAATTGSLVTGLLADVGDTFTFRRRHLGVPEVQILTYCSKLSHSIDIASGTWTTAYELSPFAQGQVLVTDDVIHGCLTGGNYFGW